VTSRVAHELASDPTAVCTAVLHRQPSPRSIARCGSMPLGPRLGSSRRLRRRRLRTLTTKRSVTRMAISITVGFMLCFIPFFVVTLVRVYSDQQYTWSVGKSVGMLMMLVHSAVNPVLYIVFSTRAVRASFDYFWRRTAPARCCHCKPLPRRQTQ